MYPILGEVFGRPLASYGLFIVLGAAAAWCYLMFLGRMKNRGAGSCARKDENVFYIYLACICGAMAGAFLFRPVTRIPELLLRFDEFRGLPVGVALDFLFGEIVFYGGFIGGAAALLIFCKKCSLPPLPYLDLGAPALALAHAFGRVGCFLGGCCYGMGVDAAHPLGVRFPANTAGGAPVGVPLLAVQLIEAGGLLIICAVLTAVYLKSTKAKPGTVICLYGLLYSIFRFVLEFYRGDLVRGVYGLFSTSQYVSIALFFASTVFLAHQWRKRAKNV